MFLSLSLSLTYPIQHFLSFLFPFFPPFSSPPFPLSSVLFSFPFLFLFFFPFSFSLSFSLSLSSSFPFLFSLPSPLFSFLSPFFPFTIFALLPDFWCRGGQSAPLPPHWLRPCIQCCMYVPGTLNHQVICAVSTRQDKRSIAWWCASRWFVESCIDWDMLLQTWWRICDSGFPIDLQKSLKA